MLVGHRARTRWRRECPVIQRGLEGNRCSTEGREGLRVSVEDSSLPRGGVMRSR